LKYIVDNSDEIVEDVDVVKNVIVLTIENETLLVSGVAVMTSTLLEVSVWKYIVDISDKIVEDVDGV
jgi:hypothetical protein